MARMHPDDLQAIIDGIAAKLTGCIPSPPLQHLSIAQQAINLARQGRHEESRQLLKAHSKRKRVNVPA